MKALERDGTLDLVDLSRDKKLLGCKWDLSLKLRPDGTIERHKARLQSNIWDWLPRNFCTG